MHRMHWNTITHLVSRPLPKVYCVGLAEETKKKVISQIEVQPSSALNSNHCTPRLIEHHSVTEKASYDEEAVETGNS